MYKIIKTQSGEIVQNLILRTEDNAVIPFDNGNRHYQDYLKWLAEGNEPLPADE